MLDYKNYVSDSDSGDNVPNAIQPVTDGELADQTVYQRPSENLRYRTEAVRKAFNELEAVVSSDRGLIIAADSGVEVTWDGIAPGGDGTFTLTGGDLCFVPLLNPSAPTAKNDAFHRLAFSRSSPLTYVTFRSKLRISEGSNNLRLEIFHVAGATFGDGTDVDVTIIGSKNDAGSYDPLAGPVTIRVQLSHTGGVITSLWSDVCTGVNAAAPLVNAWIVATATTGGSEVASDINEQFIWDGDYYTDDVLGTAGSDAQTYRVTSAEIANFFTSSALEEGDALIIDFSSAAARLAQAGDVTVGSSGGGLLAIIHRDPADVDYAYGAHSNMMNAIPICKVIGDVLYFSNGAAFPAGVPGRVGVDTTLRAELVDDGNGTGSVDCGSKLVRSDVQAGTKTPHNYAQGSVFAQLGQMLDWTNNHFKGAADHHGWKDIYSKPIVTLGSDPLYNDYTSFATALAALRPDGGIIFVTGGITDASVTIDSNFLRDITVIGITSGTSPRLDATAGSPLITASDPTRGLRACLTFRNLTLRVANEVAPLITYTSEPGTGVTAAGSMVFDSCTLIGIDMVATAPTTPTIVQSKNRMTFTNCLFYNGSETTGHTQPFFSCAATGDDSGVLELTRCRFVGCGKAVALTSATYYWRDLKVVDCTFEDCGYAAAGNSIPVLITGSDSVNNHFTIRGNSVYNTSVVSTKTAFFCRIAGTGVIDGNNFLSAVARDTTAPGTGVLYARGHVSGGTHAVSICNNSINMGGAAFGIQAYRAVVADNYVRGATNTTGGLTSVIGIVADEARVTGNRVEESNGSITSFKGIWGDDCIISNNHVVCASAGVAVYVAGSVRNVVSGNTIVCPDSAVVIIGIKVMRTSVITGNSITYGTYCIELASNADESVVSGNHIKKLGNAGTVIHIEVDRVSVNGNTIQSSGTTEGIYSSGDYCTFSNNSMFGLKTGITCMGLYCVISGNNIHCDANESDACGIYLTRDNNTNIFCTVTGNLLCREGGSGDGYAISINKCGYVTIGHNSILPLVGAGGWDGAFYGTPYGFQMGVGVNLGAANHDAAAYVNSYTA